MVETDALKALPKFTNEFIRAYRQYLIESNEHLCQPHYKSSGVINFFAVVLSFGTHSYYLVFIIFGYRPLLIKMHVSF